MPNTAHIDTRRLIGSTMVLRFRIASLDAAFACEKIETALRPRMGSTALMGPRFDGLIEDWGVSIAGVGQSDCPLVEVYISCDRLVSPKLADAAGQALLPLLEAAAVPVELIDTSVAHSFDQSLSGLMDLRQQTAMAFGARLTDGNAPMQWQLTTNDAATAQMQSADGTTGLLRLDFHPETAIISTARFCSPSGKALEWDNPLAGGAFTAALPQDRQVELSWSDALQRCFRLAAEANGAEEAHRDAIARCLALGAFFGSRIDGEFAGQLSFDPQLNSSSLASLSSGSEMSGAVITLLSLAERQSLTGSNADREATLAVANLWAAHGFAIEHAFDHTLQSLAVPFAEIDNDIEFA